MKRFLPLIIIGVVALTTLGGGAMFYWAKRTHPLVIPADMMAGVRAED